MRSTVILTALAALAAGGGWAQDAPEAEPCPLPSCTGPDVATSFGAFPDREAWYLKMLDMEEVSGTLPENPAVQGERPAQELSPYYIEAATEPEFEVPAEVGGIQQGLNNRQMERLGELDAMQGRPINMSHASNLDYVRGFTRGQELRMRGGVR